MANSRVIQIGPGQMKRLSRLLDMEYKPSELEEETGISASIIVRLAREKGLPARKTSNRNYWIHGLTFAKWILERNAKPKPTHLEPKEFLCLKCRVVLKVEKSIQTEHLPRWDYLTCTCPLCAGKVGKYARRIANDKP